MSKPHCSDKLERSQAHSLCITVPGFLSGVLTVLLDVDDPCAACSVHAAFSMLRMHIHIRYGVTRAIFALQGWLVLGSG